MKKKLTRKINSKGSASIFLVMSILTGVLAIALGSSSVITTDRRISASSDESMTAYYAAETGIEQAIYDYVKNNIEPAAEKCSTGNWTASGVSRYCLVIAGAYPNIAAIKSIGDFNSTRRSIEITF